jgi:hypothetical protein
MLVQWSWFASGLPCATRVAGYWVVWHRGERWYVGMAVPENGVGGPLGVAEYLDVEAAVPKL